MTDEFEVLDRQLSRQDLLKLAAAAGGAGLLAGRTGVASAALDLAISDLFAPDSSRPRVLRRDDRSELAFGRLARKSLLTPKPFETLEVVSATFEAGGSTGDEPYTHGDSEELLVVLEGVVSLQLGSEVFELSTGDSIDYRSSVPHRLVNIGGDPAEVMWIISPPSY